MSFGDYISADEVPGHPLSGSGKSVPRGTNEGFYPQSGSSGWDYSGVPTSDPNTKGSLWVDTTAGYVLKVSQG